MCVEDGVFFVRSSLHTWNLCGTVVTDVLALVGCLSLHTLSLFGTLPWQV